MIHLLRKIPTSERDRIVSHPVNYGEFGDAHTAALFMWGRAGTEWMIAFTGKPYRLVSELNPEGDVTSLERAIQKELEL